MLRLLLLIPAFFLTSCCILKPTARIIEKAATTTIDVAGKAAGAGIDVAKDQYNQAAH